MRRTAAGLAAASCISPKDRDLYPYNETIILWTKGGICDDTDTPQVRKLLPITSIETMTNRKEIFLQSVDFIAYDMAEELIEDDADADKQYANERIIGHAVSGIWQPNYFRPRVLIGGEDVTSGIANPSENVDSDLSIGLPMPYCLAINKLVKHPLNIEMLAAFAQKFKDGNSVKFRNYPILAIVNFWHRY
jgi:hypothetical protein